jgi:hypothetical protein
MLTGLLLWWEDDAVRQHGYRDIHCQLTDYQFIYNTRAISASFSSVFLAAVFCFESEFGGIE